MPHPSPPAALPVYVLVGGGSRRFGADKATHDVGGTPWAIDVGRRLATDGSPVTFVGRSLPPGLKGLGRYVADAPGVEGPLAGVLAALEDRDERLGPGLLVLASCDLVRPESAWLGPLRAAIEENADACVAAYVAAGRRQPFPGVAHTRWLDRLRSAIADGVRSFQDALRTEITATVEWPGRPDGPPQANTPEELRRLLIS